MPCRTLYFQCLQTEKRHNDQRLLLIQGSEWICILFITSSSDVLEKRSVCVYMTCYLFSLPILNVHMDLQALPINSATPGGSRPTGWEPSNRTGLWLMTMRRARGTSAGLPLLLSSRPSALSFWNSALCFVYWKYFLYKLQQVGYDFPQWKLFFHTKKWTALWMDTCTAGRKIIFNSRGTISSNASNNSYSLSICCMILSTFVTYL